MIEIDDRQIKEFEKDLKTFAHRAYPFATKSTLNSAAFSAQKTARRDVKTKMVTRNRFTEQSIQVDQARTLNVRRQAATVGSIADYMEEQEFGGTNVKTGREGVAIPTGYSAGQDKQQPRTRLPRKPNKLTNIKLKQNRQRRPKNRRQAIVFAIQDAINTGNRYIFLDLQRRKGIFKVIGGRKGMKRGTSGAKLKMVYDLTQATTPIPRNPWLHPAIKHTEKLMPGMYFKALKFQLQRHNLFR